MTPADDPHTPAPHAPGAWTPERKRLLRKDAIRGLVVSLGILLAIAGIAAGYAFWTTSQATSCGNETPAIATLRNLWSSQEQFAATGKADVDGDGIGEFGTFRELAGAVGVRETADGRTDRTRTLSLAIVSGAFRSPDSFGRVKRSGYYFQVLLPGAGGAAVPEEPSLLGRSLRGTVDADASEATWCAYAWPVERNSAAQRTFFVSASGEILATNDAGYEAARGPSPGAAFTSGGLPAIGGAPAIDRVGQDGNHWRQVN